MPSWRIWQFVWVAFALCFLGACGRTVPYHPTAKLRAETFDFYWNFVNENHPYLEMPGVDWQAARVQYREAAINAPSTLKFYSKMDELFASLKDPHTSFGSNRYQKFSPSQPQGVWRLDLQTVKVQRELYLYSWPSSLGCVPFHDRQYPQLVQIGSDTSPDMYASDIMWVEGEESLAIVTRYPDGFEQRLDTFAPRELMQDSPPGGFYLSSLTTARYPFMADTSLELPQSAHVAPIYLHTSGYTFLAFESVIDHPFAFLERYDSTDPKSLDKPWWINWKRLGPVKYIRISTFDDNSREKLANDRDISGWIQVACHDVHEFDKVIIDLRYNSGGRAKYVEQMLAYFVNEPLSMILDEREEFFGLVRLVTRFDIKPRPRIFQGQVVVLVNQASASAAEWLASSLKNLSNATIVGETTVGAESPTTTVTGPDGSTLSTSKKYKYPMPFAGFQNKGITPDIPVPLTIDHVREVGLAQAIRETEVKQLKAAGEALGVDLTPFLYPQ